MDVKISLPVGQTQAIQLLKSADFKWKTLALGMPFEEHSTKTDWLLIKNKSVSPVDIIFSCSSQITSADARIVSNLTTEKTVRLDGQSWEARIASPAWTPDNPIEIRTINGEARDDLTCNFRLN